MPVVVVTYHPPETLPRPDAPFTAVTDEGAAAIELAKPVAGTRTVDRAPVLFGKGIRFFGEVADAPVLSASPRTLEVCGSRTSGSSSATPTSRGTGRATPRGQEPRAAGTTKHTTSTPIAGGRHVPECFRRDRERASGWGVN